MHSGAAGFGAVTSWEDEVYLQYEDPITISALCVTRCPSANLPHGLPAPLRSAGVGLGQCTVTVEGRERVSCLTLLTLLRGLEIQLYSKIKGEYAQKMSPSCTTLWTSTLLKHLWMVLAFEIPLH